MRKVIGIGELVLDIIFRNNQPQKAVPGGSAFNCIVSLSRAGVHTAFISETGNDKTGEVIRDFIHEEGIDARGVNVNPDGQTHLSLAFLDDNNDARYVFYKDHQHMRMDFEQIDIQPDDIVIFGSYIAINPVVRPQMEAFLRYARSRGAILYYDINYRASHKSELEQVMPHVTENMRLADVFRGSADDFDVMYAERDADRIYQERVKHHCPNFICTSGGGKIAVRATGASHDYATAPIPTVSTVGAGDNFNAGFIYGLMREGITRQMLCEGLSLQQWDRLVASGQAFAAHVCQRIDNYVDKHFIGDPILSGIGDK